MANEHRSFPGLASRTPLALTLVLLLFMANPAIAEGDQLPTGNEIVQRINARQDGENVSQTVVMELIDRQDKKRIRVTRSFRKYFPGGKRMAIFYLEPANVRDTAFLTFDYADGSREDDQWLYLPALRKVRRIAASERGDSFLGTDLSYEDVKNETKLSLEDDEWKTVGEELVDGRRCYVVEGIPVSEKIAKELGYGRVVVRVDPEIWIVRKSEYWDLHGNLLKTANIRDIKRVQGIWTVHGIEVENHKTRHRTVFRFEDVSYAETIDDDLFTKRTLRRGLR